MYRFKVIAGSFFNGAKEYKVGDVVESYSELDKVFRNKFSRLAGPATCTSAMDAVALPEDAFETGATPIVPPEGAKANVKDITHKFQGAKEAGLCIYFTKGDGYEARDGDDVVLNTKPLISRAQVTKFISQYLQ
jgi:hypothetical protein